MEIVSLLTGLIKPALDAFFRWKEGEDKMEVTREQFELMKKQLEADIQVRLAEELRKPDSEFRAFMRMVGFTTRAASLARNRRSKSGAS